jgi:hypothetical protein
MFTVLTRLAQAVLLGALVLLASFALVSASMGRDSSPYSSHPAVAHANFNTHAAAAAAGSLAQSATPAPAQSQPSATQGPYTSEVLPPVVSEPVPSGRGLFDEITDRLLRALLNFF